MSRTKWTNLTTGRTRLGNLKKAVTTILAKQTSKLGLTLPELIEELSQRNLAGDRVEILRVLHNLQLSGDIAYGDKVYYLRRRRA